jgi:hypothetical protein
VSDVTPNAKTPADINEDALRDALRALSGAFQRFRCDPAETAKMQEKLVRMAELARAQHGVTLPLPEDRRTDVQRLVKAVASAASAVRKAHQAMTPIDPGMAMTLFDGTLPNRRGAPENDPDYGDPEAPLNLEHLDRYKNLLADMAAKLNRAARHAAPYLHRPAKIGAREKEWSYLVAFDCAAYAEELGLSGFVSTPPHGAFHSFVCDVAAITRLPPVSHRQLRNAVNDWRRVAGTKGDIEEGAY